jgi:hypothetical protein
MIEPGSKDRRGLTCVLSGAEYDDRLSRPSLISRAPDEYRSGRDEPERKCRHDYDSQDSANEGYSLFCLRGSDGSGALHQ